ncbi:bifunctional riboflavin kinase/FAD synthetase [Myxococcota bacterium]|nr:bifunctional riboflavin kinase/FAD synthetase [Myxococcota bacterium]MBU1533892.1 bifunctional riboflavin kinase/FAD synthetase [Myxococcota bacterium]
MQYFSSLISARDQIDPRTLLIGNFDGVHLGHRRLIERALDYKGPLAALTFDPHPLEVIAPNYRLGKLSLLHERVERLHHHGVEGVIVLPFTRDFASKTANAFLDEIARTLDLDAVVIGEAFRFGSGRSGTIQNLETALIPRGVSVCVVPHFTIDGVIVSSTKIRQFLLEGDVVQAQHFLGRPYIIEGTVGHGLGIGQKMGFPTANVRTKQLIPSNGVYAGTVTIEEHAFPAVISVGSRESIAPGLPREVEVHVIGENMNLYDQVLLVAFEHRIRSQSIFPSREELTRAIALDIVTAKDLWIEHD